MDLAVVLPRVYEQMCLGGETRGLHVFGCGPCRENPENDPGSSTTENEQISDSGMHEQPDRAGSCGQFITLLGIRSLLDYLNLIDA